MNLPFLLAERELDAVLHMCGFLTSPSRRLPKQQGGYDKDKEKKKAGNSNG